MREQYGEYLKAKTNRLTLFETNGAACSSVRVFMLHCILLYDALFYHNYLNTKMESTIELQLNCFWSSFPTHIKSEAPKISIDTHPLSKSIVVKITANESELIRQFLENFSAHDILGVMTDTERQSLADSLFESYNIAYVPNEELEGIEIVTLNRLPKAV